MRMVLAVAQSAGLQQNLVGDADLADVVEIAAAKQCGELFFAQVQCRAECRGVRGEALAVSIGVGIARFDDEREAHDDRLGRVEVVRVALQTHERTRARLQLVRIHRLGQEIVGAGVDALNLVLALVQRGDEHDRRQPCRGVALDSLADVVPAELRHQHIHQHEIGMRGRHHRRALLPRPMPSPRCILRASSIDFSSSTFAATSSTTSTLPADRTVVEAG